MHRPIHQVSNLVRLCRHTAEDVPAAFRRTRYAERFPMQGAIYRSSSL